MIILDPVSYISPNPSIVAKLDFNGKIIEAFSLIESLTTFHYFMLNSFNVLDDNSFILGSHTLYVPGTFGISANSSMDNSFIKFSSSDRSVQWVTSVDLDNNNDQEATTYVFGSSLYFLLTSTYTDYCLGSLNFADGKMQSNIWMNIPNNLTVAQTLCFILISQKWIFTWFPDFNFNSNR